jgi:hypothetical protein
MEKGSIWWAVSRCDTLLLRFRVAGGINGLAEQEKRSRGGLGGSVLSLGIAGRQKAHCVTADRVLWAVLSVGQKREVVVGTRRGAAHPVTHPVTQEVPSRRNLLVVVVVARVLSRMFVVTVPEIHG